MKMKLGISINKADQVLPYIDYRCIVELCCTLNEINHIVAGRMNCSPNKDSPEKGDITKRSVREKTSFALSSEAPDGAEHRRNGSIAHPP